jgi:hypothetical protein
MPEPMIARGERPCSLAPAMPEAIIEPAETSKPVRPALSGLMPLTDCSQIEV